MMPGSGLVGCLTPTSIVGSRIVPAPKPGRQEALGQVDEQGGQQDHRGEEQHDQGPDHPDGGQEGDQRASRAGLPGRARPGSRGR